MTLPTTRTTPPLHVAIDVTPLYGHRTGIGNAVAGLVDAIGRRTDVRLDPFVVSARAQPQPGHRRLPVPGLVASHLWSRADRPGADRWLAGADVVHGTNYVAPPTRHPVVVSIYDCWFLRHPELASPVIRRASQRLRRAIEAGALVHACSTDTARRVAEMLGTDRITTVLLGPPPAPPPLHELPVPVVAHRLGGAPFVLAIGTEERRKNLPMLIEAFDLLTVDHPGVRLVLAGSAGDDSRNLDATIDRVSPVGRSRIERLGPVDEVAKHWLLRRASVLAFPSLDEGFGFPVLEAQEASTPVVASQVGSLPEVAGDGAILVPGGDPSAFAAALVRALDDGAVRLGLIEAGLRNVRRFDWDRTAAEMVALYGHAVEARP